MGIFLGEFIIYVIIYYNKRGRISEEQRSGIIKFRANDESNKITVGQYIFPRQSDTP